MDAEIVAGLPLCSSCLRAKQKEYHLGNDVIVAIIVKMGRIGKIDRNFRLDSIREKSV